jgi:uncharacterized membrane protein YkvA (DUF1232 family)
MMNRQDKRNEARKIASVINKAKKDMAVWLAEQTLEPTEAELIAWKAGYLAGLNRGSND